jgi:hypothetical protein
MSDIVQWLEHIANYDTPQDPREGCRKAALEIKRLRKALASWQRSNEAMEWLGDDSPLVRQTREALDGNGTDRGTD